MINECDCDEDRTTLGEELTSEWKYEKAVRVLSNETNLETDGTKTVTKRVLKDSTKKTNTRKCRKQ